MHISEHDLPPELKMLTFELKITANEEARIERFIKEIEQFERVMRIDAISYTLPGEDAQIDQNTLSVTASVRVTAFYYEGEY